MKDWKTIAAASGFEIPAEQFERIGPALDGLEAAFAPLRGTIADHVEPALIFHALPEESK